MRPVKVTLNVAGYSQWIPIDYIESWFGVGVAVILSEDGNLTYSVQHTFDSETINPQNPMDMVTISRTTTVATVTDNGPRGIGHGLTTGDNIIISGSGSSVLDSPKPAFGQGDVGWNVASTPSPTTYTYTVANSGPAADAGNTFVARRRVFTHSTLNALTVRQSGSYNYPVRAIRLRVSAYSAGFVDMVVLQGMPA